MSIVKREIPTTLLKQGDTVINLHKDRVNELGHFQNEIERLNAELETLREINKKFKEQINNFAKTKNDMQWLRAFRDKLILQCVTFNTKLTIYQCSYHLEKDRCSFYNECKPRLIIVNELNHFFKQNK